MAAAAMDEAGPPETGRQAGQISMSVDDLHRLLAEERAAREASAAREAALAEILAAINASPGDPKPVFDTILAKALDLSASSFGFLARYDGEKYWLLVDRDVPREMVELIRGGFKPEPGTLAHRLTLGEDVAFLADITNDKAYRAGTRSRVTIVDQGGARSLLLVALRKEGRLLGVISIYRKEVRAFSEHEIALVRSFADQAVIAMENARLITRQREALERQTAMAEVLSTINSSPGDLQPVFIAVLERAVRLCSPAFGEMALFDGHNWDYSAQFGIPPALVEFRRGEVHRRNVKAAEPPSLIDRVMAGEDVIVVDDAQDTDEYRAGHEARRAMVDLGGARTQIMLALRHDGRLRGVLNIFRQEVRPFDTNQIALLQNFAAQAVIALENARLLEALRGRTADLQESLEYQTAISDVLKVISRSTFDLQPVLQTLLATAARLCDADFGIISTREANGYRVRTAFGSSPEYDKVMVGRLFPLDRSSAAARAALEGRLIHIDDAARDPDYKQQDAARISGGHTVIAVPMLRDGLVPGVISLARTRVERFSDKQLALVSNFADQALIAIENARLLTEQREALERQTATAEVLEVINSHPGDLEPVFDAVLRNAMQLCGAAFGEMHAWDGERYLLAAHRGVPVAFADYRAAHPVHLHADSVSGRLSRGEDVLHVLDLKDTPLYRDGYPDRRALVDLGGARSAMAVALRKDRNLLGLLNIYRQEVKPFDERQVSILQDFAAQAVVAMENARLLDELRQQTEALAQRNSEFGERIEQQAATIDVLKLMSASPGDPQPVLELIAERACAFCQMDASQIVLREGDMMHLRALSGRLRGSPMEEAYRARYPQPANTTSVGGRAITAGKFVEVEDLQADPNHAARTLVSTVDIRSGAGVPMVRAGTAIGAIVVGRSQVGRLSPIQVELLHTFAEQAVIAITSAETYNELQERTAALAQRNTEFGERIEQQAATIDVLKVMSASPGDPQPVFKLIAERAREFCQLDAASVQTSADGMLQLRAISGIINDAETEFRALYPRPLDATTDAGRAILSRDFVEVEDLHNDPAHSNRTVISTVNIRSTAGVPMLRGGEAIGAITVGNTRTGKLSPIQKELLQTFAEQAVIAITSAETYRELEERTAALAQRNVEFSEQIAHQAATIDVLNEMSASPGDAQPVFNLIVQRAREICGTSNVVLFGYDGTLVHLRARVGAEQYSGPAADTYLNMFPMAATRGSISCRAILDRKILHVRDVEADTETMESVRALGHRSQLSVPLLQEGRAIGAITLASPEPGGFTESQVSLLETFAGQAVIAITSAETYRELQDRTAALAQRNIEFSEQITHQAATIDVLKEMSASPDDAQPVFDLILRRAREVFGVPNAGLFGYDGKLVHLNAVSGLEGYEEQGVTAYEQKFPMPPTRGSPTCRAILDGRVVRVPDLLEDEETADFVRAIGHRSIVSVPLLQESRVVGAIALGGPEPGDFPDNQVALLQTFAEQAVIAITSATTYRELQERTAALAQRNVEFSEQIAHQAATIDVLKEMSASPSDAQPVFDRIVDRAREVCGTPHAALFGYDGKLVWIRAYVGIDDYAKDAITDYLETFPMVPTRGSISCRAILDGQVVHVRNVSADAETMDTVRALGHGSQVTVPLFQEGRTVGAITLSAPEPGGFSNSQIALLQTFAEQAVIAITSAENYRSLQERTAELSRSVSELQALEETIRSVNSSLDLETVLATIIDRAVQLSESDEGTIYEFDEAEQVFVPKAAYGMSAERIEALRQRRVRLGETHLGRAALQREPVHVSDVQVDPNLSTDVTSLLEGIHAVLAVPLLREDKVIGGMVIRRRTAGDFAPTIPTLLQTFAGQSVLAIENARLFQQLADRQEETRRAREAAEAALENLRRAQDRLVQSEKMASLGQLTAGVAHEIKNPLNFVNNFSDLSADLLDELHEVLAPLEEAADAKLRAEIEELTATLKGNLAKIAEHGRRADSIVKNMLEHSRSGTSERRAVGLNATAEEALNLAYHGARAEIPGFNITMEKDLDPAVGMVELYPQEFTRVLVNLINNGFYAARKRADRGEAGFEPTLRLATRAVDGQVEVRVRDNGTGIPAEVREKIFEPFFTTKPAGEGTGLGLSLSYDIVVKQHGGQLAVASEPGVFTEFTITLPRRSTAADRGTRGRA